MSKVIGKAQRVLPRQGAVYSLQQVINVLALDDTPSLRFKHKGKSCVIQTSHCGVLELLTIDGFAKSGWKYMFTTNEWIPIFEFVDADIEKFVDIEPEYDYDGSHSADFWVTPKGFPREQFYAPKIKGVRSKNNNMFVYSSYWQTWSRILQEGTVHNNFECIEVNVTPVNPTRPESWERQILSVKIRKHSTARSSRDKFVGTLPESAVADLNKYIPKEIQEFLLHEDLLPQIDWDKYREHSRLGGGADFDLIRK